MERETRSQRYAKLASEVSKSNDLKQQTKLQDEKLIDLSGKLEAVDGQFFGKTKHDKPLDDRVLNEKMEVPFQEINTNIMNDIVSKVRTENKYDSDEDTRITIIKRLSDDLERTQNIDRKRFNEKIESSREIQNIVSDVERSHTSLRVNYDKNMAALHDKLQLLEAMKKSPDYSREEIKMVQGEIDHYKNDLISQTRKIRMQAVDFQDYEEQKKMKGIEDSILKSKRTKYYFVATFLPAIIIAIVIIFLVSKI